MSSSSSSSSQCRPHLETRNWLDLPHDVTAMILLKVGAIDILNNAQRVCTQWRSISNDPVMWCTIDMRNSFDHFNMQSDFEKMCRHAIDRSRGNLVDITLDFFGSDDLLKYITDSSAIVVGIAALFSGLKHLGDRYGAHNVQGPHWAMAIWFLIGALIVIYLEYLEKQRVRDRIFGRSNWVLGNLEEDDSLDLLSPARTPADDESQPSLRMEVQLEPLNR